MAKLALFFWLLTLLAVRADPYRAALINDPDGFTYIRSDTTSSARTIAKVREREVFYVKPSEENWWEVIDQDGNSGFMHRSRIKLIPPTRGVDPSKPLVTPADISANSAPLNSDEQYALGRKFYYGTGVRKNNERAFYWIRKASDQGLLSARAELGKLYFDGDGVSPDRDQAVSLISNGALKGDARAQSLYGYLILRSIRSSDTLLEAGAIIAKAAPWFAKAVAQGGEFGARAEWALYVMQENYRDEQRKLLMSQFARALTDFGGRDGGYRWGGVPVSEEEYGRQLYLMDKKNGRAP